MENLNEANKLAATIGIRIERHACSSLYFVAKDDAVLDSAMSLHAAIQHIKNRFLDTLNAGGF
jgi:hypothetical protein